ncbi:MAG: 30S ribosomal protein S17 [Patescibacteria group bacterium]
MEGQVSKNKIIVKKKGVVVSDKMDKTIVVAVESYKTLPKYGKKYKSTKKYKVHDSENRFRKGDAVEFVPVRPISKDKKYKAVY